MQTMDEIYRQYARTVYKYLRSLTRDADLAEELTQETFYQAIEQQPLRRERENYHLAVRNRKKRTYSSFGKKKKNTPVRNAWNGLAFERVCMWHTHNIKKALGISGVLTDICSWSCAADPDKGLLGSQIDMIIVRKAQVINLLEMKYSSAPYAITKKNKCRSYSKAQRFYNCNGNKSSDTSDDGNPIWHCTQQLCRGYTVRNHCRGSI